MEKVRVGVPLAATTKFNLPISIHVFQTNHIYFYKYFWPITFTFTKTSDLSKFTLVQPSPCWMCLNQLSSWCKQPHLLLTRHDLTHVMLSISAQSPDHLATLLLHQYKQFNWRCPQHASTCDIPADAGFLCQYSMDREMIKGTLYQSGHIREVAWSMKGTTKQVPNIWHTFQMINLIDASTCH